MFTAIRELYHLGTAEFYIQILVSILALAVMIERAYMLYLKYSVDAKKFFAEIQKRVLADKVEEAIRMCDSTPLAIVVKAGLMKADFRVIDIEQAMDEASLEAIPIIEKRTPYLAMLSNAAVLIGLLGTIEGMIMCFRAVAGVEPAKKASILSQGIAVAMNATAFGLFIAIPCVIIHSVYSAKSIALVDDIKITSAAVVNLFRIKKAEQEAEL
jgi:biopolymer transport protein ExbB/TolQ